jgi:primosomal protein N' (replication factor Y)
MGRAGRGEDPGRVIIQTLNPDHYALAHAGTGSMEEFYTTELAFRQETGYPPFVHLGALYLTGTSASTVEHESAVLAGQIRTLRRDTGGRVEIFGPSPAPLVKLRGRFRWQLLLKAPERAALHRLLARLRRAYTPPSGIRLLIDVDPVDLM